MASSVDTLLIRLEATGDGQVKASLAGVEQGFQRVDRSAQSAGGNFGSLAALLPIAAFAALAQGTVRTVIEYEKLEASLRTVTGSSHAANAAFEDLKLFAATTPFELQEVAQAFIKLKALGLDPSRAALQAYGNTAAAMGKSLDQFVEAVADAATGEFERLKEFGIRAKQQGEQVTFTFRGVSTTVRKEAGEIEAYLRKIGQTDFAGAMDEQMKTLGGAFSNLKDSLSQLQEAIGKAGLSDALNVAATHASALANAITAALSPMEQAAQRVQALNGFYKVLAGTLFLVKLKVADVGDQIAALVNIATAVGPGFGAKVGAILDERRESTAKLIRDAEEFYKKLTALPAPLAKQSAPPPAQDKLSPSNEPVSSKTAAHIESVSAALREQAATYGKSELAVVRYRLAHGDLKLATAAQRDAILASALAIDRQKISAEQAGEALARHTATMEEGARLFEQTRAPAEQFAAELQRLNALYAQGALGAVGSAAALDTLRRAAAAAENEFTGMHEALAEGRRLYEATRTPAERFAAELLRLNDLYGRGALGALNSAEAIDTLRRAAAQAQAQFATEQAGIAVDEKYLTLLRETADIEQQAADITLSATEAIIASYARRTADVERLRAADQDNAELYTRQLVALETSRDAAIQQSRATFYNDQLTASATFFGSMMSLAQGQSERMFNSMKAAAIGVAIIKTAEAAMQALAAPPGPPWTIPFALAAAALGAVQVATIRSQTFRGQAHDGLDYVPSEGTYLLDEGERVVKPQDNKKLSKFLDNAEQSGDGSGSGGNVILNFNIRAWDGVSVDNMLRARRAMIVGMVQQAYNNSGQRGPLG